MLFLRSICLVAAAISLSFTSASPIQESSIDVVTQSHTDECPGTLLALGQDKNDGGAEVVGAESHDTGHLVGARETLQSLPDILSSAMNQLMDVQEEAEILSNSGEKNVVSIQACLDKVQGILVTIVVEIKLLGGKPTNVILGRCTVLELAELLCTVLTLVIKILLALIFCAGPNSDIIIGIIVKGISGVLCEVLTIALGLVDGLLLVLLPLLLGIVGILPGCGLGGILKVLGL